VKENLAFSNQSVDGTPPRKADGCEKKEKKRERMRP